MKEMIVIILVIVKSLCSLSAKHVYVDQLMTWLGAQKYCRSNFIDLSPLSNEVEDQLFRNSVSLSSSGWIGLHINTTSPTGWTWSGGDYVTYLNWGYQLYSLNYPNVFWMGNKWYSTGQYDLRNFFCLNMTVVQKRKTWEEALEYCRENQANLTSLLSETQRLLALRQIQQDVVSDPVWIGLRYLSDRWLWVNSDNPAYKDWPQLQNQDNQCSAERRCGALSKQGSLENWDCQETLSFICF